MLICVICVKKTSYTTLQTFSLPTETYRLQVHSGLVIDRAFLFLIIILLIKKHFKFLKNVAQQIENKKITNKSRRFIT